jgi:hypothetical protein
LDNLVLDTVLGDPVPPYEPLRPQLVRPIWECPEPLPDVRIPPFDPYGGDRCLIIIDLDVGFRTEDPGFAIAVGIAAGGVAVGAGSGAAGGASSGVGSGVIQGIRDCIGRGCLRPAWW